MDNEGESGGLGKVWIMRVKVGVGEGMDNEGESGGLGEVWIVRVKVKSWGVWIMRVKVGTWGRYG